MTPKHLNSPAFSQFDQQFAQADIKVNVKTPNHWPVMKGIHQWMMHSHHKDPVMRKVLLFPDFMTVRYFSKSHIYVLIWNTCLANQPGDWSQKTCWYSLKFEYVWNDQEYQISVWLLPNSFLNHLKQYELFLSEACQNIISENAVVSNYVT